MKVAWSSLRAMAQQAKACCDAQKQQNKYLFLFA